MSTASDGRTPLVAAQHVVKHFPLGGRLTGGRKIVHALDDVDIEIFPGEVMGLIGESGSGKSTMGRVLLRLQDVSSGRVMFDGADITQLRGEPLRRLRTRMSIVFQSPYAAVNRRHRVADIVAQPLLAHHIGSESERAEQVSDLLGAVGIREFAQRYPHELSGGQLQRVVLARALATNPEFIVADEPTASLDVSVRAQIVNLLSDLREERSIALLFISHDLRTVSHFAERVAVMYLGQIVEIGSTRQIVRDPRHPYTASLIAALPGLHTRHSDSAPKALGEISNSAEPPPGCRYHTRCPLVVERCRITEPRLEEKDDGRLVACHLVPTKQPLP